MQDISPFVRIKSQNINLAHRVEVGLAPTRATARVAPTQKGLTVPPAEFTY